MIYTYMYSYIYIYMSSAVEYDMFKFANCLSKSCCRIIPPAGGCFLNESLVFQLIMNPTLESYQPYVLTTW